MSLNHLRKVAEDEDDGHRWDYGAPGVFVPATDEAVFEDSHVAAHTSRFIATFDPPTVLALLDVAEAATNVATGWSDIESRGAYDEDSEELREALERLKAASKAGHA